MKSALLPAIALIAATTLLGCSKSSTTYYYGVDFSKVQEIEKGAEQNLISDMKLTLGQYQGKTDAEASLKDDFKTVCAAYENRVYGQALLLRSEKTNTAGELENAKEIARYTFRTPKQQPSDD